MIDIIMQSEYDAREFLSSYFRNMPWLTILSISFIISIIWSIFDHRNGDK